jgi:disulfide bond formation protein DsbB
MATSPTALLARHWPAIALLASLAMLAVAHAFETFGHLPPCHLCLQQREAYWWASGIAVAGLAARRFAPRIARLPWPEILLALAFAVGAAIAVRHAGAEWKWWPGPEGCSGARTVTAADILSGLNGGGRAPRCDEAAWRMFGLSMAGWNAIASTVLAALSAWAALARGKPD